MIPHEILAMLIENAAAKKILRGDRTAIASRLNDMAASALPIEGALALPASGNPPELREIGLSFWRSGLSGAGGEASPAARETKKLQGNFYTPEWVIDQVLDLVWSGLWSETGELAGSVCDPALGSGFFLIRLLDRLLAEREAEEVAAWAAENLYGVDIDPGALFLARAFLWIRLSDEKRDWRQAPGRFVAADSLLGPGFAVKDKDRAGAPSSRRKSRLKTASDGKNPEGKNLFPGPVVALDWRRAFPEVAATEGFAVVLGNPPYEVLTNFRRYPQRKVLADALRQSGMYREASGGQINLYRCFIERGLELVRPGGKLAMVVPLSLARDDGARDLRRRLITAEAGADWKFYSENDALFAGVTQSACIFGATRKGGMAEKITLRTSEGTFSLGLEDLGDGLELPVFSGGGQELWRWLRAHCPGRIGDVADMRVGDVDQTVFRECMRDDDTGCLLARGEHLRRFVLDTTAGGKWRYLDLPRFLAMKGKGAAASQERANRVRVAQLGIRNMLSRPRLVAAVAEPGVYFGNSLNEYTPKPGVDMGVEFLAGVLNARLFDWMFSLWSGNNNINLYEVAALPFPWPCPRDMRALVENAYADCVVAAREGGKTLETACRILDAAVEACYQIPEEIRRPDMLRADNTQSV